ncbi:MAG: RDD family protein [Cellvibrionaceae bacterium]
MGDSTESNPTSLSRSKEVSEFKPANLLKRLAAISYDFMLLTGLSFGYGAFALLARYFFFPDTVDTNAVTGFAPPGIIFKVGWFLLIALFFIFFWHRGGQTLGMRAWKIRVINKNGTNISIVQGFIRCCLAPLSFGLAGIGYLWCLFDTEGQTLHDKLSKSVVIQLPPKSKKQ